MSGTEKPSAHHEVTCGLEVHQQLDTGKLFSRCPTVMHEKAPDFTFKRKLHAVASELGKMDIAAIEAAGKGNTYIYQGNYDNTSLVEMDEEPPSSMDDDALRVAIEVALCCHATIVDDVLVMRKNVVDGSNTSGFQRTTQLAIGGELIIANGKKIRLQGVAIEEDSARPMERKGSEVTYRLDRLGFPLIELATQPDIHTPEEAKLTALKMGEVMRITGKVKRGLGTIRQDINISIPGGARVELKGVQELELIDEYVRREMNRQKKLLTLKEMLSQEGLTKEMIESQSGVDITPILKNNQAKMIRNALEKKHAIHAVRLPHMKEKLRIEVQPNRRVGSEISSYVKVKTGLMGLLHGDELPGYGITQEEAQHIYENIHAKQEDSFAIVMGSLNQVEHAIHVIKERTAHLLEGIPEETRNAIEGGNSEYSRPLPGASRMYPETDIKPIHIEEEWIEEIRKNLPMWGEERKKYYTQKGLSEKLAEEMMLDNKARFFEHLLKEGYDPTTCATLLLSTLNTIRRENPFVDCLTNQQLENLLENERKKLIMREHFPTILREWVQRPEESLSEIMTHVKVETAQEGEVERIIKQIVDKNEHLVLIKGKNAQSALMGIAMQALRGKAQGYFIAQALEKELEKRTEKNNTFHGENFSHNDTNSFSN
ncbi:MAG: Glu-tRNA(Gln) amidotransferase subunit GatE [Candidatus Diapherotrites archaeon]